MEQVCLPSKSEFTPIPGTVWAHRYFSTHSIEHVFLEQPVLFRLPQGIDVSQTSSDIPYYRSRDHGPIDDELKGSKADASVLDVVFGHSTKMPLQLPGSNDETQRSRNVSRRGDTASGCAGPTYR
jgi:hypothetical protein